MTELRAWCNGELLPVGAAAISLLDHGLTVGDGVFETLTVTAGRPFALTRHIGRLRRSAEGLGLAPPDAEEVSSAVAAALAANDPVTVAESRLRITYTSGPGELGSDRGPGPATLAVVLQPRTAWPPTTTVALAPWPRNERSPLTGLKTTSYAENAIALAWAKRRGHSEALLANLAGELCEGTGSNVFVVVAGQLLTPPLSSGCLAGITRELVLQWCDASEEAMPAEILETADEVFITSSTRDVHPVVKVGERSLPVGPVTAEALARFKQKAVASPDP